MGGPEKQIVFWPNLAEVSIQIAEGKSIKLDLFMSDIIDDKQKINSKIVKSYIV